MAFEGSSPSYLTVSVLVDGSDVVLHTNRLSQPIHLLLVLHHDGRLFCVLPIRQLLLLLYHIFQERTSGELEHQMLGFISVTDIRPFVCMSIRAILLAALPAGQ